MKYLLLSLFVISFLFSLSTEKVNAKETCAINAVDLSVIITQEMALEITETIVQDCKNIPNKHGLTRTLPTIVKKPILAKTPVIITSITNDKNEGLLYETQEKEDTLVIKIGDPNILITGINTYKLKYVVKKTIGENNGQGELYWDLLGTTWDISINSFRADIIFPDRVTESNTAIRIFDGPTGSTTNTLTNFQWFDAGDNKRRLIILGNGVIPKGNGVTLSAISSASEFKPYVPITQKPNNRYYYYWLIVPFIFGIVSFLIWRRYGRDPLKHLPQLVQYEPPHKLLPLELGFVQDYGNPSVSFITATIIDLAVKNYIQLQHTEIKKVFGARKSWQFILRNNNYTDLKEYERMILDELFGKDAEINTAIEIEKLHNQFYLATPSIYSKVGEGLQPYNLFEKKSYTLKTVFITLSIALLFAGLIAIITPTSSFSWRWLGVSLVVSGFSILPFGIFMPKRTEAGARIEHEIEGFKFYLGKTEKYLMKHYENIEVFERYLPYAIGFGLTKQWLKRMHDVYRDRKQQLVVWPWFDLLANETSSFSSFVDSIDQLISITSSVVSSHPSPSSSENDGSIGDDDNDSR